MLAASYRLAQPADAAELCAVARDCFVDAFGHSYPAHDLAAFLGAAFSTSIQLREIEDPAQQHRLAVNESGRIVAFLTLGPLKLPMKAPLAPAREVHRLYVTRPWQGRGVGETLLTWAIEQAKQDGAASLYLGVWRHNHGAQRFYARFGFHKVGEYLFPVGKTLDEEDILVRTV